MLATKPSTRFEKGRLTLLALSAALFLLAFASPAQAADEHVFDPLLSLEGNCAAKDGVADPGCVGAPPTYPAGQKPQPFKTPCGTATDRLGYIYVANPGDWEDHKGRIDVFDPKGVFLTDIADVVDGEGHHSMRMPCNLAVDSEGNIFTAEYEGRGVALQKPDSYPPTPATKYTRSPLPGELTCGFRTEAVAVDPSNDHLIVVRPCAVDEYGSAAEGTPLLDEEIVVPPANYVFSGVDVYEPNGDLYVTGLDTTSGVEEAHPGDRVFVFDGADGHAKCTLDGSDTPAKSFDFGLFGSLAVDQASGDLYVWDAEHKAVDQFAVDGEGACSFIGNLPAPPSLIPSAIRPDIAVDNPYPGQALGAGGYDSPNKGYVYVTSGGGLGTNIHLYAYAPVAAPEFPLTVSKSGSGNGTVTSAPAGIDCGSDCDEEYEEGTEVTLTATPDPGSEFTGWSGSGCSGTGTCEVTMSAAKALTADFEEEEAEEEGIPLTVATEGTGSGTVASDKGTISCNPFCSDEYAEGTVVVLTATPAPGSIFLSWRYCDKGGVNGRQCTMTIDKAKTVKATFTTTHALEVSKAPGSGLGKVQSSPGGILCLFNCPETSASFKEGTKVTLKQTPAKHFHFTEWLGDCTGSGACELIMGADHEVQALFAEDAKHLLTLTKSGGGQGTVKSSLAGINCGATCSQVSSAYFQGEVVQLTATPGKGSSFGGWSGAGCSGTGACTVTVSEAKGVTAEFN